MITESDHLAAALDRVAQVHPELHDVRADLLRFIIDQGIQAIEAEQFESIEKRKKAITDVAGSLNNVWPENWRELMRAEWPE